ncbi:asparaginyl-tRNA synthetase [Terfezia boudieri ATCC MYA-4762]|uniref:asparagine--tRNA ligase n=1 Tax=Terfezia boudieri ATCC MYA-4762 TaxID=1051890 RepID=A0A3N4LIZ3_9PEZI|nr:asparaginyl-tRNA synthetase [Terfezia boudieri ATCC MYA-4762]
MEKLFNIAIRTSFWSRQRRSLSRSHTWLSGEATQSSAVQAPPPHGSRVVSIATLLRDHEAPVLGKKVEPSTGSKDVPDIVTVNGWIRSNRNMKKYSFLHVADGTTSQPLQAVIPKDQFGDTKALTTGTCIQITGEWKPSPGSKQNQQAKELHYHSLKVLGTADPETYPIQKKYHTPEFLRSMPHLRPRLPTQAALLQLRSWTTARITNFFLEREFIQVHPPIITSSDCEGAGEVFTQDHFFRSPKYLTVSSQLHLECFAHAVPKVWTLSPTFRAEKSDTNRHLSEFYMLEAEIAFTNSLEDVMFVVENMTRYLVSGLIESRIGKEITDIHASRSPEEAAADGEEVAAKGGLRARWESFLTPNRWTRMTYTQAVEHLSHAVAQGEVKFVFEPIWGNALQAEHEKFLARKFGGSGGVEGGPLFVTDYPTTLKPFYMLPTTLDGSDETVACFDLLLPHVGELVGGSLREHRYEHLVEKMRAFGLIPPPAEGAGMEEDLGGLKWYAELRKWGSVTHGGFGMGYDRLLAYLAGIKDIREVVGFPRWRGRCDC